MRRATTLCFALLLISVASMSACKRKETLAPVHLDEVDPVGEADVSLALAPAWGPPRVVALGNGLLVHWLEEDGRSTAHLRLFIPLHDHGANPALALVSAHALLAALERDLAAVRVQVELAHRPGRLEIALHVDDEDLDLALGALTSRLAERKPGELHGAGLKRASKLTPPLDTAAAVANEVVLRLIHGDESGEVTQRLIGKDALSQATRPLLEKNWPFFFDPRDCLLVVHASGEPNRPGTQEALLKLSKDWTGAGSGLGSARSTERDGVARMTTTRSTNEGLGKKAASTPSGLGLIGAKPFARYVDVKMSGARASFTLARLLSLPDAHARGVARLAQRMLQEEFDARLVIHGELGLFALRVPVAGGSALASLQGIDQRLRALAKSTESRERLRGSALLWLGARAVETSLQGEDWSALWSESLDLCTEDNQIRGALAREGLEMLRANPEEVRAFIDSNLLLGKAGNDGAGLWLVLGSGVDEKDAKTAIESAPTASGTGDSKEKR